MSSLDREAWGRRNEGRLVDCPVCGKKHELEPKGDALRWHRVMLMRAPLEAVQRWDQIRKRKAMSTDLRSATIRLASQQPQGSKLRKALLDVLAEDHEAADIEWRRIPSFDDFKNNPEAGKLYGQLIFWSLHNDGSPRQKGEARKAERALTEMGFNQWGIYLDNWPPAKKEYLALARKHNIEPEAVRRASRRAYETGEAEADGWNPGSVTPSSWPEGEGSQMPPARDLRGLQVDQNEFKDNHFAKGASLRTRTIRLASSLPQGSEMRLKLLAALKTTEEA